MQPATRQTPLAPRPARHLALVARGVPPASDSPCATCYLHAECLPGEGGYARKRVRKGESLFRAGGIFDSLYSVRSGFFKTRIALDDGRDQVAGFHMAGDMLGLEAIGAGRHNQDAIALEDSEVCILPYEQLLGVHMQRPLHRAMGRELARDHGLLMMLGSLRAEERLAAFLLDLSQRYLAGGFSAREFHLRMTRDELGSYLGLSLETVSRLFSRFQQDGHITVQQKHIRILDAGALRGVLAQALA